MAGEKIGQLNFAIREALPAMRDVAQGNPHASVEVKVLEFSSGARWLSASPIPLDDFSWSDVSAEGITDMGEALSMMAKELAIDNMPTRSLPPVVVLVTDGQPTDNFQKGLDELMAERWGQKSVRVGIAIGADADLDVLQKFIGTTEFKPLRAVNAPDLTMYIRWVSTQVLTSASSPASQAPSDFNAEPTPMDMLPPAPVPVDGAPGVW